MRTTPLPTQVSEKMRLESSHEHCDPTADLDRTVAGIGKLVSMFSELHEQALAIHAPEVEAIIRTGCRDVHHIEKTLDGLLNFADDNRCLQLYRRLCRHYWNIDPVATAEYVLIYRRMWDPESLPETQS